jgi:hypothetical protein
MGGCIWAMGNTLRIICLQCVVRVHSASLTRFAAAHTKAVNKLGNLETQVEVLTEDVIEVVGPFIN